MKTRKNFPANKKVRQTKALENLRKQLTKAAKEQEARIKAEIATLETRIKDTI